MNPSMNEKTLRKIPAISSGEKMTINGSIYKTALLLAIAIFTASITWKTIFGYLQQGTLGNAWTFVIGGAIGGFIFAIITIFKKEWAPVTAPIYAALEGVFLGGISLILEMQYPGIVLQAVGLTFGTMLFMLAAYRMEIIRVTEKFKSILIMCMGGIFIVYLATFILSFFNIRIPYIHSSGMVGIGFSLFVVVIASLTLLMDFDFIVKGSEKGLPKKMEWYASFGLMLTLVWLYFEILRLLAKLRDS